MMTTMQVLDLRRFKEAMVSFGMYSFFVRQMLNSWSTIYPTKLERLGYSSTEAWSSITVEDLVER